MRTILGFLFTIMLVPVLMVLFLFCYQEWNNVHAFHKVLDEKLPSNKIELPQTSFIKAADGTVVSEISGPEKRIYLPDKEIPPFLKDLFVAIEDKQFYRHSGVDAAAISRAMIANSRSGSIEQGGSTITQQLARNVFLTHEKSYNRKLTELLYSFQLERTLSKQQILELYINAIYYHNRNYGIEAASRFYFNKRTQELSKAQLAYLAAIPNNPELYNPLKHFHSAKKRQERILLQMVQANKLSAKEYEKMIREPITLHESRQADLFPDYTDYVQSELKDLIANAEGLTKKLQDPATRSQAAKELDKKVAKVLESGVTIHTALDTQIQQQAKRAVKTTLSGTQVEGSAVVIQHNTHELVSLIGGTNYKKNSFNRAYQAYRQPGSAIKPLLVYAPYIQEKNASILERVSGQSYCRNGYCPKNYGGGIYGMVTIKKAFANSYNTPAIRLLEKTGIKKSFGYLDSFNFVKVTEEDHRLPSAVGGFQVGVSPLELTDAFTSFHEGTYLPAHAIQKVTSREGKLLYKWNDKPKKVWRPDTVAKMRQLLHEVTVNGTAKRAYFPAGYIGGKTGTTNDVKDMWFVGLTDQYTTGVWVGKDHPSSLESIQHAYPNQVIWKEINQNIK
ncbi:transglycosylase domain-containing protein [Bacillus sp. V5-8f]|uniref:transglycosylase domain-containing protein n=1 Tax=Bacillus sp. V5-8f TaxID=2053044 RepID=UPI000C75AF7F|nr:transglycosylase domain-containing protein [Bacillus sp. V5-8f]PLT34025.1 penicillin-binding protein [Bacillus sp. V5-8f]